MNLFDELFNIETYATRPEELRPSAMLGGTCIMKNYQKYRMVKI